ncbi:MAG: hypothetical protein ABI237_16510 [Ginsengibacter sp.]
MRKSKITDQNKMRIVRGFSIMFSVLFILPLTVKCQKKAIEIHRFPIGNAIHLQGVAVDGEYFYAISNFTIAKYRKSNGSFVSVWDRGKDSIIRHLNSGVVINGKLYCANSNFPENPMVSSIEIFDTKTMKHIGSHSFGIFAGSATWVDRKGGFWWVVFANYNGKHSSEGRDNRWTTLVKFNNDWNELESWVFPREVLEAFAPNSNSGGNWSKDGKLYITGHDKKEMYIMKLPDIGYTLQLLQVVPVINPGQAIAIDRWQEKKEIFYSVNREDNAVIVQELK